MKTTLLCLLLASMWLSGCADDGADDDPGTDDGNGNGDDGNGDGGDVNPDVVNVVDDEFEPEQLAVDAGTEVTFMVADDADNEHNVLIHEVPQTSNALEERGLTAGDEVSFTFENATTYHVWCDLHGEMTSGMAMVVTVT
jgi:plastocyanin